MRAFSNPKSLKDFANYCLIYCKALETFQWFCKQFDIPECCCFTKPLYEVTGCTTCGQKGVASPPPHKCLMPAQFLYTNFRWRPVVCRCHAEDRHRCRRMSFFFSLFFFLSPQYSRGHRQNRSQDLHASDLAVHLEELLELGIDFQMKQQIQLCRREGKRINYWQRMNRLMSHSIGRHDIWQRWRNHLHNSAPATLHSDNNNTLTLTYVAYVEDFAITLLVLCNNLLLRLTKGHRLRTRCDVLKTPDVLYAPVA